ELPHAYAIVHPRHPEGSYPFGGLSGAGVAFKVATALLEEVPEELLDLAAIGTVADLVSLTGENRTLVTLGLKVLQQTTRPGL
ncbi:single-stranded-DNA-specific exonuclease RecJ, partial [Streptococcus thermophilus]|nr:single-stranded-DNA-specific exonuclease RecJ [Streptococcus thermophilus]